MATQKRQAKVTDETREESSRLKAIWDRTSHPAQAEFGELYGIGNQSAVAHFLNGRTPISKKAATGFAKGLGCRIGDFSPRLAAEIGAMSEPARDAGSPALQLAVAFDALPDVFEDGGTKIQFLSRLLGLIQERPHLVAQKLEQAGEPNPPLSEAPKKRRGTAHAR